MHPQSPLPCKKTPHILKVGAKLVELLIRDGIIRVLTLSMDVFEGDILSDPSGSLLFLIAVESMVPTALPHTSAMVDWNLETVNTDKSFPLISRFLRCFSPQTATNAHLQPLEETAGLAQLQGKGGA